MTFGLITEGITDQLVIDTIINTIINHDAEKAITTPLCPMDEEPSGWTKVFTYISSETFKEGFKDKNFYAVIQVDTDTKGFWSELFAERDDVLEILQEIPVISGGHSDKINEIVSQIEGLIRSIIGPVFYDTHRERILLAIAINEIECWVLPFHATKKSDLKKMVNCLNTLNTILKKDGYCISPNAKASQDYKFYRNAIKGMFKHKVLLEKYEHNESLKIFVDRLLTFA